MREYKQVNRIFAEAVRVGLANATARYYLNSSAAVRRLLRELVHE